MSFVKFLCCLFAVLCFLTYCQSFFHLFWYVFHMFFWVYFRGGASVFSRNLSVLFICFSKLFLLFFCVRVFQRFFFVFSMHFLDFLFDLQHDSRLFFVCLVFHLLFHFFCFFIMFFMFLIWFAFSNGCVCFLCVSVNLHAFLRSWVSLLVFNCLLSFSTRTCRTV